MHRAALFAAILASSSILFFLLSFRAIAQYQYSQGLSLLRNKQYASALIRLKKSTAFQGGEARNWKAVGDAYHALGGEVPFSETYPLAIKARDAYRIASRLNPMDAENFFGLAVAEQRLERLYPFFHTGKNPHDPLPYIHRAISLYPKNLLYHFFLADYYYTRMELDALEKTVFHAALLSPESYGHVKKQPYWKISTVKAAFRQGLLQAIQDKTNAISAHTVMAAILESEKEWKGALSHYEKLPVPDEKRKAAQYYFHLGRLYENAGEKHSNSEYFANAVRYYQKAVTLDQWDSAYQRHYEQLTQKYSVTQ